MQSSKCMDPSPLHSLETGVDFWKSLSDGFTMERGAGRLKAGGEERGVVLVAHKNANELFT